MADNPNKYLFSMVAIVAITGLFLIFMGKSETGATEDILVDDTTGMVVGYGTETGQFPQFDEKGNKICSGKVIGDSIVPDYIPGCGGPKVKLKGWSAMPPAVKAYYKNKHVAFMRVPAGTPGVDWRAEESPPRSVKGGNAEGVEGGTMLPDQAVYEEGEVIEVLEAGQLRTSTGTIV